MQFQPYPPRPDKNQPQLSQETFQARFFAENPRASEEDFRKAWREYRLWLLADGHLTALLTRRDVSHGLLN